MRRQDVAEQQAWARQRERRATLTFDIILVSSQTSAKHYF